jgi:uncharacterized protein YoxC
VGGMFQSTFDELTTDEKFRIVRDDIRLLVDHSNQNQQEIDFVSQSVAELRSEIDHLTQVVAELLRRNY